ncbi:hypothetical protein BBK82_19060 [Lentzea guizhouensis]|uniref:Subtilisin inhibitor domain-containing protein n=1 Tax=Lentzea guizhouensis TaxID=1586287 RepID=A0A1B2HJH5_9PSEU|nr:hypothetical protein [Lentzea guizhouensis]ANZ37850.1 hypothetical protein BBK82_19060 [Lentzea guizhouensis]
MGRFLVALALSASTALLTPQADARTDTQPAGRWQIEPCPAGQKALWLPRVDTVGTDLSCTTEDARNAAVKEAADSGSPKRLMNVAIAGAQQLSDKSITPDSSCVPGAKAAVGDALGTCVPA